MELEPRFDASPRPLKPARRSVADQAAHRQSRSKRLGASAIAAAVLALGAASAHAYDITTSPYLLGDWGGLRTRLADQGVTFNLGYGSELAHNFSGGTEHLTLPQISTGNHSSKLQNLEHIPIPAHAFLAIKHGARRIELDTNR